MPPRAYYNEIDPYAAEWIRNLISAGVIAPGEVDTRDIRDVFPDDLLGFAQCHFFAGIGVWSYALRRAGWPDSRRVWTGSCPCQPFSTAGRGGGFSDERHLWPAFFHLIREFRPERVLGEQVASKDGLAWLDLVHADLEGEGYAVGAADLCAAGVGAPHIRQRLWWVADDNRDRRPARAVRGFRDAERDAEPCGAAGRLADDGGQGLEGCDARSLGHERATSERGGATGGVGNSERLGAGRDAGASTEAQGGAGLRAIGDDVGSSGTVGLLGDAAGDEHPKHRSGRLRGGEAAGAARVDGGDGVAGSSATHRPGPTNGFWRDPDWLLCRDGRWRPVEPGTFPLVDGSAFRVDSGSAFAGKSRSGMLKGAGNAIVAEAAVAFIEAVMEAV